MDRVTSQTCSCVYFALKLLLITTLLFGCTEASTSDKNKVSYSLGKTETVRQIYPDKSWLPEPYQSSYTTLEDTITYYTKSSLENDKIEYDSVKTFEDKSKGEIIVEIDSDDPAAKDYGIMHPAFINNYAQALIGINKCKSDTGCWNKNNESKDEPWAFFPQFGMAMAKQNSVLLLNYPPASALVDKSYLDTFTMKRWGRVLTGAGVAEPTLFEVIVDVRPIAAPASNTSQNLPDSQKYFNDPSGKTGGYYITPQLKLMLDPPSNKSHTNTLPLVVLGGPAREAWKAITKIPSDDVLTTGRYQLADSGKSTSYILGNHPTVTTYQCCENSKKEQCDSFNLLKDEGIDYQVNCWANSMAANPEQDPKDALKACHTQWVSKVSPADALILCTSATMDNNSCFGNSYTQPQAQAICQSNHNNACPSTGASCPSSH